MKTATMKTVETTYIAKFANGMESSWDAKGNDWWMGMARAWRENGVEFTLVKQTRVIETTEETVEF